MNSVSRAGTGSVFRGPVALACVLFLFAACGGDDDGDDTVPAADANDSDAQVGPVQRTTEFVGNRAGSILLTEGAGGFINYGAFFYDAPEIPTATLVASAGECEVWTHPAPALCDPPCFLAFCAAEDECVPYPALTSHGVISTTGLAEPVSFTPIPSGGYLQDPPSPPEELFAAGDAITAAAPGADGPSFELAVEGVPALEADLDLEFDHTLRIEDGVDETIRWTAEGAGRIQLALLTGHHGSPYEAILVCESEDDGELVIPGEVIAAFPRARPTGLEQHSSWIARFDRAVTEIEAGPIELFLSSRVIIPQLEHP